MNEAREPELQDWFNRSVADLPNQPFTLAVMGGVQRRERLHHIGRYAALVIAFFSLYLLLPELVAPLSILATLPGRMLASGYEQRPLLVVPVLGIAYWLLIQARNAGYG